MGGAGEAGVIGPDGDLDLVEKGFGGFKAVQRFGRDRANRFIHGLVVAGCRDDQVRPRHQALIVCLVVVEQGTAWRLDDADAAAPPASRGPEVGAEDVFIQQQGPDSLCGIEEFDHPGPVIGQHTLDLLPVTEGHERLPGRLGQGLSEAVNDIHPGQRSDPIPARFGSPLGQEGKLHVGPGLDLLQKVLVVVPVVNVLEQSRALGAGHAQRAVIKIKSPLAIDQPHETRSGAGEIPVSFKVLQEQRLGEPHGEAAVLDDRVDRGQQECP